MIHSRDKKTRPPRIIDSALLRNIRRAVLFNIRRILKPAAVKIDDIWIGVDYANWSAQMIRHVLRGDYEERERKTLAAALSRSDRVLEIGGGVGLIALTARRTVPDARIRVYEANPALVDEIEQNFARNGADIDVIHGAIVPSSSEEEAVRFHIAEDFWASSLLPISGATQQIAAPAIRLGDAIKQHKPTVVIMDVEGAECDLLDGCDLTGVEKLLIEFHQRNTGRKRANALIERLLYQGFELDLDHCEREVLLFARGDHAAASLAHEAPAPRRAAGAA